MDNKVDPWELLAELREHFGSCDGIPDHLWDITDVALAERQDFAKDAVESDEVKWVRVNPSEYRAIVGAAKVGVWKQYDKELWAWEMRHRSKPYQCGEVRTEAEAKEAAVKATRSLK
jgi:hypothetical protein